jgi:uroporphyrinogen III methyltransferase/synthase
VTPEVLVTRPADQAADLAAALRVRGVIAVTVPTVAVDFAAARAELDRMLAQGIHDADWLVITSANGASALAHRLAATGRSLPSTTRIAAVGPATALSLARAGLRVDHVPSRYLTVAIADGLGDVDGMRVVLARADSATADLSMALATRGADVMEVVAYHTIEGPPRSRDPLRVALQRELNGVTFTSSSTVRGLLRLASPTDRHRARATPAFCIGPVTADTARRFGFDVAAVAEEHTCDGLAAVIDRHLNRGDR